MDQTGHSPSSARASSTQGTSAVVASAMSGLQLGGDPLAHPAVHGIGLLFPAEDADRRDAVKPSSRRVAKKSSQSTSPLPISLCWWTRASTPGGLTMYRCPCRNLWL